MKIHNIDEALEALEALARFFGVRAETLTGDLRRAESAALSSIFTKLLNYVRVL